MEWAMRSTPYLTQELISLRYLLNSWRRKRDTKKNTPCMRWWSIWLPEVIAEKRKIYKGVNANVDFYSGLVYGMLDLPPSLYTPIFAAARIVGWSAHRLEELKNVDKIIRPAYKRWRPTEIISEWKTDRWKMSFTTLQRWQDPDPRDGMGAGGRDKRRAADLPRHGRIYKEVPGTGRISGRTRVLCDRP